MLGVPRRLFLYTKGVPVKKPDKTKPKPRVDDDVRLVTICDPVVRALDNIATTNVPEADKNNATEPPQILRKKKAAEIANETVNRGDTLMKLNEDLSC